MSGKRLTHNFVNEQIQKEGFELLFPYINHRAKTMIKCTLGHTYTTTYNKFQRGRRCPICSKTKKLSYNFIKESFNKDGYKLLSEKYKNANNYLDVLCPNNHIWKVKWGDFQQGHRCGICAKDIRISKGEKEILEYVKTFYNGIIVENDRTQIINPLTQKMLELDIWLPELKKAIEYNGGYWHNNKYSKLKDTIKQEQCIKKGINLLVIKDKEWKQNKNNVLRIIRGGIEN